jgi:methionyl-tRNA synthetase
MSQQPKRYTITAALPYANGPLHIGHVAGAYLPADIYVRYLRSMGKDVAFICGSDEHGAAITLRAKKEGVTPQEIVDKYHGILKKSFVDLGIDFDIYHRTSDPMHHQTAQGFFKDLNAKGSFETETSKQFYDEENNQFLADRYVTGTCPKCGHDAAYGDQCENCGSSLSSQELINPKSVLSGKTPVLKETTHWYLPMGRHENWMKDFIEKGELDGKQHHNPKDWKHHVLGQSLSWINSGLQSRSMTRDLDWGVKVPVEGAEGKVLYVWLDAPIGYISATKKWAEENGKDWKDYWQSEDAELIHFIGKDNIVFHCIIFPIILKEHGSYILPKNVPANEFLNLEGSKISTSRDWAVWIHEYLEEFKDQQDQLRYVLGSIMPENRDSEFTWNGYKDQVNNELADILGNFVNRAVVLTQKYYEGKIPQPGEFTSEDKEVIQKMEETPAKIGKLIESYKFREAQLEAMNLARLGNKYLADSEPWKLIKTDPDRVKTIMYITLQITANLCVVLEPFLPFTTKKMAEGLKLAETKWPEAGKALLEVGHQIDKIDILFKKVDDETVEKQVEKLNKRKEEKAATENPVKESKEDIVFEDFTKLDIRVGEIKAAEKIPKTKKLLKLTVDTGIDERTIVSGIAEHYDAEEVVGKKVSLLVNLAPRKIKGVESQGMILMAEGKGGELSFVSPEKGMEPGDVVS